MEVFCDETINFMVLSFKGHFFMDLEVRRFGIYIYIFLRYLKLYS